MNDSVNKAAEWWDDPQNEAPGTQWGEVPGISENVNRRATGDSAIDWMSLGEPPS